MNERIAKALAYLRTNGVGIGLEILFNFVGPYVVYQLAKKDLGDVGALMASSAPPIAWSLIEFIRRRRIDALSVLVLTGIALSLLAFFGGGGPRFLQMRESLVGGGIGLLFLGSAAIGRPLTYQLARANMQRRSPDGAAELEGLRDNAVFKRVMLLMTLVWGFGLVTHTAVSCALIFSMSIAHYLIVGPIVGYGFTGALIAWTFWYGQRQQRLGRARRAAAEAAAGQAAPAEPQITA